MNVNTFNTLIDNGYDLMTQFEFIEKYSKAGFTPQKNQKIAISFQGHELCRGRGGMYDNAYFKKAIKPLRGDV